MAAGVPVVQPAHGAFTEMVRATGGGLLVKPDDPRALAEGLWQLYQDRRHRVTLGRQGAGEVRTKYSVKGSAERLEAVLREVTAKEDSSAEAAGPAIVAKEERARAAR
jgi:glycosyltransferase involved in cell wall biosynthesis